MKLADFYNIKSLGVATVGKVGLVKPGENLTVTVDGTLNTKSSGDGTSYLSDDGSFKELTIPADISDLTDTKNKLFDGNYNSLSNKPTIPTVPPIPSDVSDLSDNQGLLFDGNYNSLSNQPNLFDGNYNSLSNKPTIPTIPPIPSDISDLSDNQGLLFDGNYNSLSNLPTIETGGLEVLVELPEPDEDDLGKVALYVGQFAGHVPGKIYKVVRESVMVYPEPIAGQHGIYVRYYQAEYRTGVYRFLGGDGFDRRWAYGNNGDHESSEQHVIEYSVANTRWELNRYYPCNPATPSTWTFFENTAYTETTTMPDPWTDRQAWARGKTDYIHDIREHVPLPASLTVVGGAAGVAGEYTFNDNLAYPRWERLDSNAGKKYQFYRDHDDGYCYLSYEEGRYDPEWGWEGMGPSEYMLRGTGSYPWLCTWETSWQGEWGPEGVGGTAPTITAVFGESGGDDGGELVTSYAWRILEPPRVKLTIGENQIIPGGKYIIPPDSSGTYTLKAAGYSNCDEMARIILHAGEWDLEGDDNTILVDDFDNEKRQVAIVEFSGTKARVFKVYEAEASGDDYEDGDNGGDSGDEGSGDSSDSGSSEPGFLVSGAGLSVVNGLYTDTGTINEGKPVYSFTNSSNNTTYYLYWQVDDDNKHAWVIFRVVTSSVDPFPEGYYRAITSDITGTWAVAPMMDTPEPPPTVTEVGG